jgi:hypothetical protein
MQLECKNTIHEKRCVSKGLTNKIFKQNTLASSQRQTFQNISNVTAINNGLFHLSNVAQH